MDDRDLWVRAEWQRLTSTPERLRHFGVSELDSIDLEVEELVVRMLYAEFDSRSPSERARPSTPNAPFMIEDRYLVCGLLGFGGQARTWFARDERTGDRVALKELDLGRLQQWKSMQLFEREAEILARLDHPGVPHYLDSFKRQDGGDVTFFMAMEFVRGETLEEELAAQGSFSVESASVVRDALLETLAYLHAFAPPVVHRDIKPSNIIRTPEGRIVLVDFGAVQASASKTMGGSTVVGTGGYAPIEQFMGKAVPSSDLYALGATLTHLLTGVQPSELPTRENRLVFEQSVRLPQEWTNGLGALLEPAVERRPPDVEAARRAFVRTSPTLERAVSASREQEKGPSRPSLVTLVCIALVIVLVPLWTVGPLIVDGFVDSYVDVENIYEQKPANARTALFVGNSHIYWGLPRYIGKMAESTGQDPLWFDIRASPGRTLDWHIGEGIQAKIRQGGYDIVFVQPQSMEPATRHRLFGADLGAIARATSKAGSKGVVMTTWARHPKYDVYDIYPRFGDFDALSKRLDTETRAWASTLEVCPVGTTIQDFYNQHDDIEVFSKNDGNHINANGAYLFALVAFGCVYDHDPAKVTWSPKSISRSDVEVLKAAASRSFHLSKGDPAPKDEGADGSPSDGVSKDSMP